MDWERQLVSQCEIGLWRGRQKQASLSRKWSRSEKRQCFRLGHFLCDGYLDFCRARQCWQANYSTNWATATTRRVLKCHIIWGCT